MRLSLLAAVAVALAGCGRDDQVAADPKHPSLDSVLTPLGTATITGLVRFIGRAPVNPHIEMSPAPLCRGVYHAAPRQLSVVVNRNRTLANVFVFVKRGLSPDAVYPAPSQPVTVVQRGCQYQPRVRGVMVGQTLRIRDDDPLPHQVTAAAAGRSISVAQPGPGRRGEHTFQHPRGVVRLGCALHPWMRGFVGVVPHPFYSVTGDDGRFTIEQLPAGTYTIESWHERYGRRSATVSISNGSVERLDLIYTAESATGDDGFGQTVGVDQ